MHQRRAALAGLARILDAGAPEDLFTGAPDEAMFLYRLLTEAVRARASVYYWEICRTARRRGVTPEYVIDRATVLLGAIQERRRTDLYRILGVPPLASPEVIRQRWLEVVKRLHPDTGGDGVQFQQAKQAYEVLRSAERRAAYERFWLQTLGPVERAVGGDDVPRLELAPAFFPWRETATVPAPGNGHEAAPRPAPAPASALGNLHAVLGRAAVLLAPIAAAELERLQADVAVAIAELEALRGQLRALAALKARLQA